MDEIGWLDSLPIEESDSGFWSDVLKRWMLDCPSVTVLGIPSESLGVESTRLEHERVARQVENLGPAALVQCGAKLEAAIKANETAVPNSMVESVAIPSLSTVSAIPITTVAHYHDPGAATGWALRASQVTRHAYHPDTDTDADQTTNAVLELLQSQGLVAGKFGYGIQWDHVRTAFSTMKIVLDTSRVPDALRPYCLVFCKVLLELPIRLEDDTIMPYEEVVEALLSNTVIATAGVGHGGEDLRLGSFPQLLFVHLKFETSMYEACVQWAYRIMFRTVFDAERIRIAANKYASCRML